MSKCRNVMFTIFTEPESWYQNWMENDLPEVISYLCFQREICPESKREHIQGYAEFTKQLTFTKIKELFNRHDVHLEARKGTGDQAVAYCTKEESRLHDTVPCQRGARKEPGRRTDLEAIAREVMSAGRITASIAEAHPAAVVRNFRGLQQLGALTNPPRMRPRPEMIYMEGPPGCGKSRLAWNMFPDAYGCSDQKEAWFDGYMGQMTVIFDDFEGNFPLRSMLKLIDFYPLQLPVKGTFVPIKAHRIVITSNHSPEAMYSADAAWLRRLNDFGVHWKETEVRVKLNGEFSEVALVLPQPLINL